MSEHHPTAVVRSRVDSKRRLSLIWAIPAVTVIVGAWLAWSTVSRRGPLIGITFETAEGLQAGQSHVRYKDVDMGVVESVGLTEDRKRVLVMVRMSREAEPLLTEKAQFWAVRPRFFAGSISGLQTLFSGSYIDMYPSSAGGEPRRDFVGLENPPVLQSDVPGRTFLVRADRIGSINLGSPVMFRDMDVGEVLGWDVGEMARNVTIHVFVREPFEKYVHDNSRFWNASGAKVQLGTNGLEFKVESLRAVVFGGIAFDTPEDPTVTEASQADHVFRLFESQEAATSSTFKRSVALVVDLPGSAAGLEVGSPVTLRGLKVGAVTDVALQYDKATDNIVVPVHFTVEPERVAMLKLPADGNLDAWMAGLVRRGLRVRLETSSFLTGQKQLAIDLYPDAPPGEMGKDGAAYVLPVLGGGGDDIATSATKLVSRLNAIPFESIGKNLDQTLAGVNKLANDKQLAESVAALHAALTGTQALIANLNNGLTPAMKRLPAIAAGLEDSVKSTDKLIGSLQGSYGDDSRFNRDVGRLMAQLSDAARSIRVLADLLSRHPEALIRGRAEQGEK